MTHDQDDPAKAIRVSGHQDGVDVWIGDELAVRLSWDQAEALTVLLAFEMRPYPPETVIGSIQQQDGDDEADSAEQ